MTPAEVLAAAADKLEALASGATPDLRLDDVESGLFPEDIVYIAAMNPLVGKALAEMLHEEAAEAEIYRGPRPDHLFRHALRFARLINGSES